MSLTEAKDQVLSLLRYMQGVPEFTKYFINDLIDRANSTIQEIVRVLQENEFDNGYANLFKYYQKLNVDKILDPLVLILL